jgi:hypothetical protein
MTSGVGGRAAPVVDQPSATTDKPKIERGCRNGDVVRNEEPDRAHDGDRRLLRPGACRRRDAVAARREWRLICLVSCHVQIISGMIDAPRNCIPT